VISVPYPPNEVQPVNLPLRLALSRLVAGVITGEVIPGQWNFVTSLARSEMLEIIFLTTQEAVAWLMEGIDTPLCQVLCWLQEYIYNSFMISIQTVS